MGFRRSLRLLLEATEGFAVIGEWARIETALADPAAEPGDVLLLDIDLPGISGDLGVSALLERWPSANVLMLTASAEEEAIFNSLCRGANGYLLKGSPPEELLSAVADVVAGGSPMSPAIARSVVHALQRRGIDPAPDKPLSSRESDVLSLLARGRTYEQVGSELGITVNTVRNHIRSIYEKLQVHSRSEAVSKALRARLI